MMPTMSPQQNTVLNECPWSNWVSLHSLRRVKAVFRCPQIGPSDIPLSELNIRILHDRYSDASDRFRHPREVQISEWLRLIP